MAALTINGITVPIRAETYEEQVREVGEQTVAFDGSARKSRLTTKRDASFDLYTLPAATAHAWEQLLRGLGEVWHFENSHYGTKGTGPSDVDLSTFDATVKFGSQALLISSHTPASFWELTIAEPTAWVVSVWRKVAAANWENYIVDSSGKKWVDGVRNDAASTTWLTFSTGVLTLIGDTASDVRYDDLVVLPFTVPTAWPEVWGVASSAFSDLPKLTAAGDVILEASSRTVLGDVEKIVKQYAYASGSNAMHHDVAVRLTGA